MKNCLVATYGIQGLAEKHDFFGYLDVYFNYDSEENYQILDLQFEEYDPTATVTDSSTDGDETAENQADSVAGAAAMSTGIWCRTIFIWICKLKTGMEI